MSIATAKSKEQEIAQCQNNNKEKLEKIQKYWRLVNYLAAAQIYLQENFLLKESLKPEHIKDRLLGHWGTTPGINFVYAHLNRIICQYDLDMFLVTGPGHGAPANLANLYVEQSLEKFYPELTLDYKGLAKFVKMFSWPGGFPSHLYPGLPGTIHEGGELGYALATSFGAVMDNPDLIVACMVGDGEAETGPTATAWHSYKFIDPAESGAVLPILHLNGYKISNPTIFGTMSDEELIDLFKGYGYEPRIIENANMHADMYLTLDWAVAEIKRIQGEARSGRPIIKPRWPMLILRSLKGWTGIKEIDGVPIEGSFRSHQVPAKDAKVNSKSLKSIEKWLHSYHVDELIDEDGSPIPEILSQCPKGGRRMGCNPHTFGGEMCQKLNLPIVHDFAICPSGKKSEDISLRGTTFAKNTYQLGLFLREVISKNPKNFRIFSPDELESNQLMQVFDVTHKNYQWPIKRFDTNISNIDGRVCEILSEHSCQGWLQGYLMTGRHGLFPSYEAFLSIVATMMLQFTKFLKFCRETEWRTPFSSLNYLETSTLWRQEHNGFSHQTPIFLNILLNMKENITRIYLPPDANCLISTFNHCLKSRGYVNLVVASKHETPQWLSMDEAIAHCRAGGSVWPWASTENGINPDVVLVGIGDVPHIEVMAAAYILRKEIPELRIRVVNVTDLLILAKNTIHPHGLDDDMFEALFTKDQPVIINFHGYPSAVTQLIYNRGDTSRIHINGYIEEGTTTTPFDMTVRNKISRFHLIMQAIRLASPNNPSVAAKANKLISHYTYVLQAHRQYILEHGDDPPEISEWKWS